MAKRLRTRLSAGAALVTGIGMMGIATATPAQADADLTYTCTTEGAPGSIDVTVNISATDTETATVGDEVTVKPTGTATLDAATATALRGAGYEAVAGDIPDVKATISDGTQSAEVSTNLTASRTQVTSGENLSLPLSGTTETATVTQTGEYTISAPETFTADMTGYSSTEDSETTITAECTHGGAAADRVIDTVTVSDAPEADDWFTEPDSLPLVDNTFTVEGEATHDGVITVEVLSGVPGEDGESTPGQVLKTYTMNATEGANTADYDLVEGADYVRLVSQDCVDADGNDETVAGGCNVTYKAPWANDGTNDDDGAPVDEETPATPEAPADDAPAQPEVPQVVQTDGLTPASTQEDNTAALALGSLLLAGAGAGTVLIARRRAAQH